MNSDSKARICNDDCQSTTTSCCSILKCSFPTEVTQTISNYSTVTSTVTNETVNAAPINIAILNLNTSYFDDPCIYLDFNANVTATSSVYSGTNTAGNAVYPISNAGTINLALQLYRMDLCNSKCANIPVGIPFNYSIALDSGSVTADDTSSTNSRSESFSFSACDCPPAKSFCYSYFVEVTSYSLTNLVTGTFGDVITTGEPDGSAVTSFSFNNPSITSIITCNSRTSS